MKLFVRFSIMCILLQVFTSKMLYAQGLIVPNNGKDTMECKNDTMENGNVSFRPLYDVSLGLGFGIDYGGLGVRFTYLPIKYVAFFGCVGYNFLELGYNAGAAIRILPESRICPTVGAMYGYNAVVIIKGAQKYNKTYYGMSGSFGLEFRSTKMKNFFNLEILLPFKSDDFDRDMRKLKNDPSIEIYSEPLPIYFSLGFHAVF